MDYKLVLQKFVKGMVFGAGAALFSVDLSTFALNSVDAYQKFGVVILAAVLAGALHGIWEVGKQVFGNSSTQP